MNKEPRHFGQSLHKTSYSALCFGRWLLSAAAALTLVAPAEAGTAPPFPLGVYVGNPDGNSAANEAAFETQFNSFTAAMGAKPKFMDAYVDYKQVPSSWPSNASWTAWSWTQSPVVGSTMTPIIGIPMSDNAHWQGNAAGSTNDDFFQDIIAGTHDADYTGIVDAWVNAGFKTFYLRLGYEMDGTFMPWFMGSDAGTQAHWVAAFQRLSTIMKAEAVKDGAIASIVWNPADVNWTALDVKAAYPGDDYVDVISSDAYSPLYPTSLWDWSYSVNDASIQEWWTNPVNNAHFWNHSSASQWNITGAGSGWGMQDTINLAALHGKAIALSETGAGDDGKTTGPLDVPQFPKWLAGSLNGAVTDRLTVAYVAIWDVWESDGDWDFTSPGAGKPREAKAWATYFGGS